MFGARTRWQTQETLASLTIVQDSAGFQDAPGPWQSRPTSDFRNRWMLFVASVSHVSGVASAPLPTLPNSGGWRWVSNPPEASISVAFQVPGPASRLGKMMLARGSWKLLNASPRLHKTRLCRREDDERAIASFIVDSKCPMGGVLPLSKARRRIRVPLEFPDALLGGLALTSAPHG
ncbi:hypothetical protein CC78DRAFT_577473 [Lojkania enalia]|uniref:Uncharacterized protein n=1 Tax=Lojkania enalia TaxID=147567 RepID=A0A9P4KEL6_9PLEO|nr:hypothetical protein CC78DRAFT_577473 [Didymosphaeria enalia]